MEDRFFSTFGKSCETLKSFRPPFVNSGEGYQVLDFFSGCGGMSLGFAAQAAAFGGIGRSVGFDIFPQAVRSYRANFGEAHLLDVRELSSRDNIPKTLEDLTGIDTRKPTILIGCPPCQGFSAHTKTRGIPDDLRNSLVVDFAKIAIALKPDAIVLENVPEILEGKYRGYWDAFSTEMAGVGYRFTTQVHNLAGFGVPQQRRRAVCIATRGESVPPMVPVIPPSSFATVRDAISDLPETRAGERHPLDALHRTVKHRPSTLEVIAQVPPNGGSRPRGVGPVCLDRVRGFYDVYGRLSWDKPSITITKYSRSPACGRFTHPEQNRCISAREAARLQSFPDGFVFEGSLDDIYRQIGEAVPPRAAAAVASWLMLHLRSQSVPDRELQLVSA